MPLLKITTTNNNNQGIGSGRGAVWTVSDLFHKRIHWDTSEENVHSYTQIKPEILKDLETKNFTIAGICPPVYSILTSTLRLIIDSTTLWFTSRNYVWKHLVGQRHIIVIDIYSIYALKTAGLVDCSLCIAIEIIINLLPIIRTNPEINLLMLSLVVIT